MFEIILVVSLSYAAIWGGGPERVAAMLYTAASIGSLLGGWRGMPGNFSIVPTYLMIVDIALLVGLIVLTLRAARFWLIPATSCQLVAVAVHISKLMAPSMIPTSYAFLTTVWSWPMVLLLAFGSRQHSIRIKYGRIDLDWKPISVR